MKCWQKSVLSLKSVWISFHIFATFHEKKTTKNKETFKQHCTHSAKYYHQHQVHKEQSFLIFFTKLSFLCNLLNLTVCQRKYCLCKNVNNAVNQNSWVNCYSKYWCTVFCHNFNHFFSKICYKGTKNLLISGRKAQVQANIEPVLFPV